MIEAPVCSTSVPNVIGHYRIVQKLRSGGMGDVYLAEDEALPRVVAIKFLPDDRCGDEMARRRFLREAQAAALLTHPNVARIYEAGQQDGALFIAMERVEGESLDARIARGPMSVDEVIGFSTQLAAAAEAAHHAGVIHRDIKPSNIMITPSGELKVLDFGLARFLEEAEFNDSTDWQTRPGLILGTPPYMSPEQALGKDADSRSDIFSVGVVLYEMTTGRAAFAGKTTTDTLFRVVNTQPEAMARFNYELPQELERIVRKCIEKVPARRYQSASELLVDLRNFERDRLVPPARRYSRAPLVRAVAGALLLVAVAVAGIIITRTVSRPEVRSVAVLPFENRGGRNYAAVTEAIGDDLISQLARSHQLRVKARGTSFRYRSGDPLNVARALHVDAVITGSLTVEADRLVILSEIVAARDGGLIGVSRVERPAVEMARIPLEVENQILDVLKVPHAAPRNGPPVSEEAFRLYSRGRQQWNLRTAEGFVAAIESFRQAIEIEPKYAAAWAGLADTYTLLDRYAPSLESTQSRVRAQTAAERAIELDPSLAAAHASLASIRETYAWDWTTAESEYRRAIALSPSYAVAHHWLALLLARLGRFEEANREIAIARELDPLSPIMTVAAANIHYYERKYPESIREAREALAADDSGAALMQLGASLTMSGQPEQALAELNAMKVKGSAPQSAAVAAVAQARAGRSDAARAFLRAAQGRKDALQNAYAIAAVHAALGEREAALDWLTKASAQHSNWIAYLAVDPMFESLHGDPRFTLLLAKAGLVPHA